MDASNDQAYTEHTIHDGVVRVRYVGRVTPAHVMSAREAFVADPDFVPGMDFVADFTLGTLADFSTEDMKRVAVHGRRIALDWGPHRTALVAPADVAYGMSRMFQMLGTRPGLTLQVFRDLEEAEAWLREDPPADRTDGAVVA